MDQRIISNYRFVIFGVIFYLIWKMPIVSLYCNTYIAMFILFITFVLSLDISGLSLRRFPKFYILVAVISILSGITQVSQSTNIRNLLWAIFLDVFPVVMGYILVTSCEKGAISKLSFFIILTMIITAITTTIGLQVFPNASRELATGSGLYQLYYRYNIGGFSYVYGLVLLHPMLVGFFKYKVVLLIVIGIIISYYLLPTVLNMLASLEILESSSGKIYDLANMLQGSSAAEYDTNARIKLYSQSWDTFLSHPFLGTRIMSFSASGGHSFILDFLSDFGILGGIVLFRMYIALFKNIKHFIFEPHVMYYAYFTMSIAIVLSILNPNMWLFSIGIVTPVIGKNMSNYVCQKGNTF